MITYISHVIFLMGGCRYFQFRSAISTYIHTYIHTYSSVPTFIHKLIVTWVQIGIQVTMLYP